MVRSVEEFIKNNNLKLKGGIRKPGPKMDQIRYNFEKAPKGEMDMNDPKGVYYVFIIYRNPRLILDKIESSFTEGDFRPSVEEEILSKGQIHNSVNEYTLAKVMVNRNTKEPDFSFTTMPAIKDNNLTSHYKKHGNIEDYIKRLI